jgi:hypothetical protein
VWYRLLQTARSQHKAPLEERETGAAKHLALEPFQAYDLALHGPGAPGQGQPGLDGVIIISKPFSKPLQCHESTLGDPCHPGIQLRTLPLAHESGKVLGERDRLRHVGMLRAQLGEQRGLVLGARLLTPQDQPGRLAGREEPLLGLGHHGQRWPKPLALTCLALRLAQALNVTGDCGLAARIATPLELAIEAHRISAAGVPPFQEIRFIRIEDAVATVTAAPALW